MSKRFFGRIRGEKAGGGGMTVRDVIQNIYKYSCTPSSAAGAQPYGARVNWDGRAHCACLKHCTAKFSLAGRLSKD